MTTLPSSTLSRNNNAEYEYYSTAEYCNQTLKCNQCTEIFTFLYNNRYTRNNNNSNNHQPKQRSTKQTFLWIKCILFPVSLYQSFFIFAHLPFQLLIDPKTKRLPLIVVRLLSFMHCPCVHVHCPISRSSFPSRPKMVDLSIRMLRDALLIAILEMHFHCLHLIYDWPI